MMFGLKTATISAIHQVLAQHPALKKAILYGSRARGNYRPGSDIDLTLEGETLDLSILHKIENDIEELMLPYRLDVSLKNHIKNTDLLDHIRRVGLTFYEKDQGMNHRIDRSQV